jgi:hypothetical protein
MYPFQVYDSDGTDMWGMELREASTDTVRVQMKEGSTGSSANASSYWTTNTWQMVTGVLRAHNDKSAYRNGGSRGNSSISDDATNLSHTSIGRGFIAYTYPFVGRMAELAIWDVDIGDTNIARMYNDRLTPLAIKPHNLAFYMPMVDDSDNDLIGGYSFTENGTLGLAAHPNLNVVQPPRFFAVKGPNTASSSLPAYLVTDTGTTVYQEGAYVETEQQKLSVYQEGAYAETSQELLTVYQEGAYAEIKEPQPASSSLSAYLVAEPLRVEVAQAIAYAETEQKKLEVAQAIAYAETEQVKLEVAQAIAYAEIQEPYATSTSLSAYLAGNVGVVSSLSAYAEGAPSGTPASSSLSAYLNGVGEATSSLPAFLWSSVSSSMPAYMFGATGTTDSLNAYTRGKLSAQSSLPAYLASGVRTSSLQAFLVANIIHGSLSAYLYSGYKASTSLSAYLKGVVNTETSLDAYLTGHKFAASTRHAYMMCGISTSTSMSAFLSGRVDTYNNQIAFLKGSIDTTSSLEAYIKGGTAIADSLAAYLNGIPIKVGSLPAYLEGTINFERASMAAYAEGIHGAQYWQSAYLRGGSNPTTSLPGYLRGGINVTSSLSAFLEGPPLHSMPAYLKGKSSTSGTLSAFTEGLGYETNTSQDAFLEGKLPGISSMPAYLEGYPAYFPDPVSMPAYTEGIMGASDFFGKVWMRGRADATPTSLNAYLYGHVPAYTSTPAYTRGIVENFRGSLHAFMGAPVVRTSLSCFTEGLMAEYAYIRLVNSNSTLDKFFRVVAQGYDDGSLEKSVTMNKTIGGGLDVSMGDTYTTWNPIIRVRHDETESGYGDLADLETFYKYNDPGGTPSNVITFYDNHGVDQPVYMVGSFKKQYLGAKVEGTDAWLFVKMTLVEKV